MADFPNNQNYYDVNNNNILTDAATGNKFINGVWVSPQGTQYINGQWIRPTNATNTGQSNSQGFNVQAGYGMNLEEFKASQQKYLQELQGRQQMDLQRLSDESKRQFQTVDNQLKLQLAQKQIDAEQYNQMKTLAQQESEFARTLAQKQMEFQHQKELDQANLEINKAAEMRQERQLQANLAANPQDWVAYEFYKRGLNGGAPGTVPAATGATPAGVVSTPTMLGGEAYQDAPPAYSDQSIQSLATSLFNPGAAPGGYNPNIKGTGVFGTSIEAPNTLTRAEAGSMSTSEMGMLAGLLKGGVDMGGKRVALDPADYFQQAQNSWIPTFAGGTDTKTAYV